MPSPCHRKPLRPAHVIDVVRETPSSVTILFETTPPLDYRPGQYVSVEFRFGSQRVRRAYSLSSVPGDDHPAITVKQQPGGKLSIWLANGLSIGDRFAVGDAQGDFVLPDSRAGRTFVFVAGGAGITPILALVRTLLAMREPPPVRLVYYVRGVDDILFRERFEAMAARHPVFRLQLVVTGARGDWSGLQEPFTVGRVLAAAEGPGDPLYYICGPESLNAAAVDGLRAAGVPAGKVFVEHFTVPPVRERPDKGYPVTFRRHRLLLSRRTRVRGQSGETLLATAERAGLKIRTSCRNGTCGSCRVHLASGEVVMDEPNGLSLADAQAGRVLACVAYASSPVEVDLP